MSVKQTRGDYKEIIELALIVLGVPPKPGYKFKAPGANHRARWMARVLYTLKIYLFRLEFPLPSDILNKIQELCLFFCSHLCEILDLIAVKRRCTIQ
jgi:hypothetical protein